jgi:hypothetical protein
MRGASMKSLSITRWVITDLPLWVKPPGRRGYATAKPNCSKALSASAIPRWLVLGHVVGCAKHRADRRRFAWQWQKISPARRGASLERSPGYGRSILSLTFHSDAAHCWNGGPVGGASAIYLRPRPSAMTHNEKRGKIDPTSMPHFLLTITWAA